MLLVVCNMRCSHLVVEVFKTGLVCNLLVRSEDAADRYSTVRYWVDRFLFLRHEPGIALKATDREETWTSMRGIRGNVYSPAKGNAWASSNNTIYPGHTTCENDFYYGTCNVVAPFTLLVHAAYVWYCDASLRCLPWTR